MWVEGLEPGAMDPGAMDPGAGPMLPGTCPAPPAGGTPGLGATDFFPSRALRSILPAAI